MPEMVDDYKKTGPLGIVICVSVKVNSRSVESNLSLGFLEPKVFTFLSTEFKY